MGQWLQHYYNSNTKILSAARYVCSFGFNSRGNHCICEHKFEKFSDFKQLKSFAYHQVTNYLKTGDLLPKILPELPKEKVVHFFFRMVCVL